MLEKVTYYNHLGESISFGAGTGYFINYNDLRDYEWAYDTEYGKVVNFRRAITKKSLPILVSGATSSAAITLRNALYALFEKDIVTGEPGCFKIGDYKLYCYVYASQKSEYLNGVTLRVNASVIADTGAWIKEDLHNYVYDSSYPASEEMTKDYEYDYEYDYALSSSTGYVAEINNTHFSAVDWIMNISSGGSQESVEITIGTDVHKLNYTVPSGGYVSIDSKNKTITAVSAAGVETNIFNYRDKETDIFAKIPVGISAVAWNGEYNFTLTLLIERSEPIWT